MHLTRALTVDQADRLPPQNVEAERAVLGSLLIDPQLCDDIAVTLRPEDFYSDANRKIFEHIVAMHDAGGRIDMMLLVERLRQVSDFDAVGGAGYLAEVAHSTPVAAHAAYYAEIVRGHAQRRAIISAAVAALQNAHDPQQEPQDVASEAQAHLDAAVERTQAVPLENAQEIIGNTIKEAKQSATTSTTAGLSTGLSTLDSELGGLQRSELTILAARPRMGKSAMMGQIVRWNVLHGRFVYVVSLEMTGQELVWRMLCAEAGINANAKRTGTLTHGDVEAMQAAADRFTEAHFLIDDRPALTLADITRTARRLKRSHHLALIAVDYLQLIEVEDRRLKRHEAVGEISRGLKRLARTLDLPVLALAQLNREVEGGKDPRPKLSHLRESGAIEQDADLVAFIHRPEIYKPDDPDLKGKAELIVEKNRSGPAATFQLRWHGPTMTFTEGPNEFAEFEEFK